MTSASAKTCKVEECGRAVDARGLCPGHYARLRRDGDVHAAVPLGALITAKTYKECSVDGCERRAESRGWCMSHYSNWHAHGDPVEGLTQQHGGWNTPEYKSWTAMKTRCDNPKSTNYPGWGGRGIAYVSAWADFRQFLADMGPRPDGTSLDRIDNDGNYEPGNCRWATPTEQNRNRRLPKKRETCKWGHAYTPENTAIAPQGYRICRTCKTESRKAQSLRSKKGAVS